jgi:O-antigen/teichoic acid export membrane protein
VRQTLVGKGVEIVVLAVLVVAVPRVLGPTDYGRFAVALSVVTLVSAGLALGGPALLSRYVPAAEVDERPRVARALAERVFRLRLAQIGVVVLAAGALVVLAPNRLGLEVAALVTLAIAFDSGATLGAQVLLGLERTVLFSFRYPIQNALLCCAVLGLYHLWGTTGAIAGITVSAAVVAAVVAIAVRGQLHGVRPVESVPVGALRFGALQTIGGVFVQLVHRGTVIVVVLLSGSSLEAGFAALASGVALALTYVVAQAFAVELPRLAARFTAAPEEVERSVRRLAWLSLAVTAPAALAAVVVVEAALPRLVGSGFSQAIPAFGPALAIIPLAGLTAAASQLAALHLVPGRRVAANAAGAGAFVAVAVVAVPLWGSVGGTTALYVATVVSVVAWAKLLPGILGRLIFAVALGCSLAVVVLGATI